LQEDIMARETKLGARGSTAKCRKRPSGRKKRAANQTPRRIRRKTPSKPALDIKTLARLYAPAAIQELARLSVEAQSEAARVSAIDRLLDRAYGRPNGTITGNREKPLEMIVGVSASLNAKLDRIANAIAAGATQD
jgi:hypothetical protein